MAGNTSTIQIEVRVDGKGGIKVLRQIGTESEKTGKKGSKSFRNMDRSVGAFNKRINLTHGLVTKLRIGGAVALTGITVGVVALTRKVISLGREFEFNMKTVQAWSGATGTELKSLIDIARKMGATTEHTATQAAGALKFLAAAGFTAKQSIAALPGTLNLSTAGQIDLARATDITTDVLTAFGMQVSELNRVSDAFITTSSSSNTNVLMLGESFKMVAPTAKLFGLNVEQTAAFLGTLANSGIKAEMAGSGLNMVLMRSAMAAKKLGLDAMTPLIDVLRKMKEEQWDAVKIGAAFGVRQVKTAAILMNNIDMYEKLTQKIIENKEATAKLAKIMRDSLDVDLKTLNSTIEEELLRTFDRYKDDIREIVQDTTAWIKQNTFVIDELVDLAKNMAIVAVEMGKIIGLGAEYVGVWMKTWQAMGLASTGMITWRDALLDSTHALELFETEQGRLQLQARLLEQQIIDLKKATEGQIFYFAEDKAEIKSLELRLAAIQQQIEKSKAYTPGRLEEALEDPSKYYGTLPEIPAKAESIVSKAKPDAKALKEAIDLEAKLWEYEVRAAQRADDEIVAAHEAMIEYEKTLYQEAAKNKISMTEKMYSDLKFTSDDYYVYQLNQLQRQSDDYEKFTGNTVLAHLWLTEQIKALDKERLEAADIGNQHLIDLSQRTSDAMEDNFSSFYRDFFRGELDSAEDYFRAFCNSLTDSFSDMLGQMTKDALMANIKGWFEGSMMGGGGGGGGGGSSDGLEGFGGSGSGDSLWDTLVSGVKGIGTYFGDIGSNIGSWFQETGIGDWYSDKFGDVGGMRGTGPGTGSVTDWSSSGAWSYDVLHKGGTVGVDAAPTRMMPASLFAHAPRLHRGLAEDEFPAILQKGETVIPRGQASSQVKNLTISVPVTIEGQGDDRLASKLSYEMEETAKRVMREEMR